MSPRQLRDAVRGARVGGEGRGALADHALAVALGLLGLLGLAARGMPGSNWLTTKWANCGLAARAGRLAAMQAVPDVS